jgi:ketosteroid isomerase-like protein
MLEATTAQKFAEAWVKAWNAHDLEAVLAHYSDDFEMSSPLILTHENEPTGTLRGKERVRAYWQRVLTKAPNLRFSLVMVLRGVNSIVIHFRRETGQFGAETLIFDHDESVVKGMAHWT